MDLGELALEDPPLISAEAGADPLWPTVMMRPQSQVYSV